MTVVLRLYAYYVTVDGSTLTIICRRDQGRIKTWWRQYRLQLAVVHAYFGSQLEISRTGVYINSTAGRPSGWALPRILVITPPIGLILANHVTPYLVYRSRRRSARQISEWHDHLVLDIRRVKTYCCVVLVWTVGHL